MAKAAAQFIVKRAKPGRIHAVLSTLGSEIARDIIPVGAALPPEPELETRFGVGRGVVVRRSRRWPRKDTSASARATARAYCPATTGACSIAMC